MFARCSRATVAILLLLAAGSLAAEPAQSHSASPDHLIEPPDILHLDGGIGIWQTWGIVGDHLVRPDGFISLRAFGRLKVVGLTVEQVQSAIMDHLSKWFLKPEISVRLATDNRKSCYVIRVDRDFEQIDRIPCTDNKTVVDAIVEIPGMPTSLLKKKIWLVRPAATKARWKVLPIDWKAIVQLGATQTNYQLIPGDQIHIAPKPPSTSAGLVRQTKEATTSAKPPQ